MKVKAALTVALLAAGCATPQKQYSYDELVQMGRQNTTVELCWFSQAVPQYRDAALQVLQERGADCDWDEVSKFHGARMLAMQQQQAEAAARESQFNQSMQLLGIGALIMQNNRTYYQPQQHCTSRFMAGSWHTSCF